MDYNHNYSWTSCSHIGFFLMLNRMYLSYRQYKLSQYWMYLFRWILLLILLRWKSYISFNQCKRLVCTCVYVFLLVEENSSTTFCFDCISQRPMSYLLSECTFFFMFKFVHFAGFCLQYEYLINISLSVTSNIFLDYFTCTPSILITV